MSQATAGTTRLRWVHEVTGAVVLFCVGLFVAGLLLAGRAQGWFEKDFVLRTTLKKSAMNLQRGTEVQIQGALAGRVGDIVPDEQGDLQTTYILRGRFRDLIRTNSVAVVKKKFQIFGDAYVEITPGDRRLPPMEPHGWIETMEDVQLLEKIAEFVEDARLTVIPMLEEVQNILMNVNEILLAATEGKGLVGALLREEALVRKVEEILEEVERTTAESPAVVRETTALVQEAKGLVEDLRRLTGETEAKIRFLDTARLGQEAESVMKGAREAVATAEGVLKEADLPSLLRETERMLREVRRLTEALQRHWLLRRYREGPDAGVRWDDPWQLPVGQEEIR